MNKNLRNAVIAGNWKMNKTPQETKALIEEMKPLVKDADCKVIVCVPFVDLHSALDATEGSNISVGAQNCHWEKSGAFTGEVSAEMLKSMGVPYVIIGHSERRSLFGDTDETVKNRVNAALESGLNVILCVGEHKSERELNITNELIRLQTKVALSDVKKEDLERVIIAYEPVWAIGTGLTATPEQANDACKEIRNLIAELYDENAADKFVVQYGGSMNAANADELLAKEDIDGGLIGGASLKAEDFSKIIKAASV